MKMRLSDAIAMGRTLIKLNPDWFLTYDCTEGCAIGMGMAAIGKLHVMDFSQETFLSWPWLAETGPDGFNTNRAFIGGLAARVYDGEMTLDQLIDWVRSVEPVESENSEVSESQEIAASTEPEYASVT